MPAFFLKTADQCTPGAGATRDGWLPFACLAVSLGLHVLLVAAGWQLFAPVSDPPHPLMVSLLERSAVESPRKAPAKSPDRSHPRPSASAKPLARPLPDAPSGAPAPAPAAAAPVAPAAPAPAAVHPEEQALQPAAAESSGEAASGAGSKAGEDAEGAGPGGLGDALFGKGRGGRGGGSGSGAGNVVRPVPRYESNPWPAYPRLPDRTRPEGVVRLRVKVTAGGAVEGVTLERSSGHEVLDRAALEVVPRWRFIPATLGGKPIPLETTVTVPFRLK